MPETLDAARAAVQRSDQATPDRTQQLIEVRTALRALIQWAEDVDRRLATALPSTEPTP